MTKRKKIWLIVATLLTIAGVILFAVNLIVCDGNFSELDINDYQINTYEINEDFDNITINTTTADILFVPASDGKCKIECCEREKVRHTAGVEENTLMIEIADERKWYEHIGFSFKSINITVYLPKTEYCSLIIKASTGDIQIPEVFSFESTDIMLSTGDVDFCASATDYVKINTSTGDVQVKNITTDTLEVFVTTGELTVSDVVCKNFLTKGSTGDVELKNTKTTGKTDIERSTGDVKFDGLDSSEIVIQTSTGNVKGTLLGEKLFITKTSTGKIMVPDTTSGGECLITTTTGDIIIKLK